MPRIAVGTTITVTYNLPLDALTAIQQRLHGLRRDLSHKARRMVHNLRFAEREVDLGLPVTGNESLSHG